MQGELVLAASGRICPGRSRTGVAAGRQPVQVMVIALPKTSARQRRRSAKNPTKTRRSAIPPLPGVESVQIRFIPILKLLFKFYWSDHPNKPANGGGAEGTLTERMGAGLGIGAAANKNGERDVSGTG